MFGSKGMAASENPLSDTGTVMTAAGTRRPPNPHFFLERYSTSYVEEWRAFVDTLRRAGSPGHHRRRARLPGHRHGRVALVRERRPVEIAEVLEAAASSSLDDVAEVS